MSKGMTSIDHLLAKRLASTRVVLKRCHTCLWCAQRPDQYTGSHALSEVAAKHAACNARLGESASHNKQNVNLKPAMRAVPHVSTAGSSEFLTLHCVLHHRSPFTCICPRCFVHWPHNWVKTHSNFNRSACPTCNFWLRLYPTCGTTLSAPLHLVTDASPRRAPLM